MLSGKAHCRTCGSKSHTTENCKQEIKCFRCNGNGHVGYNCKVNGWNIFCSSCVGENMLVDDRLLVEVGGQFLRACVSTKINDNFIGIKTAAALFGAINDKERKSFSLNDYTFTNIGKIAVKLSNGSDGARAEVYVLTTDDFEKIHDKASIIIGKQYATNMKSARAVGQTIGRKDDDNGGYVGRGGRIMGITDGVAAQSQSNKNIKSARAVGQTIGRKDDDNGGYVGRGGRIMGITDGVAAQSQLNQSAVVPAAWPDDNLQYEAQMTIVQSSTTSNANGEIRRTTLVLVEEVENSSLDTDH